MNYRAARTLGVILLPWMGAPADGSADAALERGFADPPAEARPGVMAGALDGDRDREGRRAERETRGGDGVGGRQSRDPLSEVSFVSNLSANGANPAGIRHDQAARRVGANMS